MSSALRGLVPQLLWEHFSRLSAIPRQSRREQGATDYVLGIARTRGLEARRDAAGNVLVVKPATAGRHSSPSVALQGHIDMVCEKRSGSSHDFDKDPLRLLRAGDHIIADQTTLGADNGIGVAAALAVMEDPTLRHGPIEFLFTVDEETGLHGASALEPGFLTSRLLLNLDSEEHGALYIGCAGSRGAFVSLPVASEAAPPGCVHMRLSLSGLQGGHSGVDIDKSRGNAIRILARALWSLSREHAFHLVDVRGGSKRNAIPRDASALIVLPPGEVNSFRQSVEELNGVLWGEWGPVAEPKISLAAASALGAAPAGVVSAADQHTLISLLYALPTGVVAMSAAMPGLVETSLNLAVISMDAGRVVIELNLRSSVETAMDELGSRIAAVAALARASVEFTPGYPAWRPNPASHLLHILVGSYHTLFGSDPSIRAVHAGLECAVIGGKYAGLDMVSFGPTIAGAHSPDERVEIASVEKFWRLLTAALDIIT